MVEYRYEDGISVPVPGTSERERIGALEERLEQVASASGFVLKGGRRGAGFIRYDLSEVPQINVTYTKGFWRRRPINRSHTKTNLVGTVYLGLQQVLDPQNSKNSSSLYCVAMLHGKYDFFFGGSDNPQGLPAVRTFASSAAQTFGNVIVETGYTWADRVKELQVNAPIKPIRCEYCGKNMGSNSKCEHCGASSAA